MEEIWPVVKLNDEIMAMTRAAPIWIPVGNMFGSKDPRREGSSLGSAIRRGVLLGKDQKMRRRRGLTSCRQVQVAGR